MRKLYRENITDLLNEHDLGEITIGSSVAMTIYRYVYPSQIYVLAREKNIIPSGNKIGSTIETIE
jgi:hypothetical protein